MKQLIFSVFSVQKNSPLLPQKIVQRDQTKLLIALRHNYKHHGISLLYSNFEQHFQSERLFPKKLSAFQSHNFFNHSGSSYLLYDDQIICCYSDKSKSLSSYMPLNGSKLCHQKEIKRGSKLNFYLHTTEFMISRGHKSEMVILLKNKKMINISGHIRSTGYQYYRKVIW